MYRIAKTEEQITIQIWNITSLKLSCLITELVYTSFSAKWGMQFILLVDHCLTSLFSMVTEYWPSRMELSILETHSFVSKGPQVGAVCQVMHTYKGAGDAYCNLGWAEYSFTFLPYDSIPLFIKSTWHKDPEWVLESDSLGLKSSYYLLN